MPDLTPEQQAVQTLSRYLDRLLVSFADELNASSSKRKTFFVFLMGGVNGFAISTGLSPEQAQAVAVSLLLEELAIAPIDGLRVVQFGVDAAAGETAWSYAAHAGVDEFFAWQADPAAYDPGRLRSVLDRAPEVEDPPRE